MTRVEFGLVVVAVLLIVDAARAEWRYGRLVRLFADLATMTGDYFDREEGGSDG